MIDETHIFDLAKQTKHKILTKQEEIELLRAYQGGDVSVVNELIECNVRFIHLQIRKLGHNLELISHGDDIFQQAVIGYLEAIRRYDLNSGMRLNTYACHWIRHEVTRYIYKGNCTPFINVPPHHSLVVNKIVRCMREYDCTTPEEVHEVIQMEIEDGLVSSHFPNKLSQIKASWEFFFVNKISSYDSFVVRDGGEDTDFQFLDVYAPTPEVEDNRFNDVELTHKLIKSLRDERTADIIIRRFGINCEPETLDEIGKSHGITRERVRQIEAIGLKQLRKELKWHNVDLEIN